jgi:hypothetical protein
MDKDAIKNAAAREWAADSSLRSEFTTLAAYQAFRVAIAGGRARISNRNAITATSAQREPTRPPAPAARASTAPHRSAPAHAAVSGQQSGVQAAMKEFFAAHQSFHRRELVAHVAARCALTAEQASEAIIQNATQKHAH